jgi:Protein of unknown function (DUF3237)
VGHRRAAPLTGPGLAAALSRAATRRRFEVGDDSYRWLTGSLFLGRGRLAGPKRIEYHL